MWNTRHVLLLDTTSITTGISMVYYVYTTLYYAHTMHILVEIPQWYTTGIASSTRLVYLHSILNQYQWYTSSIRKSIL